MLYLSSVFQLKSASFDTEISVSHSEFPVPEIGAVKFVGAVAAVLWTTIDTVSTEKSEKAVPPGRVAGFQ